MKHFKMDLKGYYSPPHNSKVKNDFKFIWASTNASKAYIGKVLQSLP